MLPEPSVKDGPAQSAIKNHCLLEKKCLIEVIVRLLRVLVRIIQTDYCLLLAYNSSI